MRVLGWWPAAIFLITATGPAGGSPAGAPGACVPLAELEPELVGGRPARIEGRDVPDPGSWGAGPGDRLTLRARTPAPGDYEILLRGGSSGLALEAWVWSLPLALDGEPRFRFPAPGEGESRELRLDPIPLGPGYQALELEARSEGRLELACVGLRRVGPRTPGARPVSAAPPEEERPFLGVSQGAPRRGGVQIRRVVAGSGAQRAGLRGGDVLVGLAGAPTPTWDDLVSIVASQPVGAEIEVELLREGKRLARQAVLGPRPADHVARLDEVEAVLEVLDPRPGQTVADLGCGSGWLSRAIAERVGPRGRVYAVEIQEDHVRRLHRDVPANVVPVHSDPGDVFLPEDSLDWAMLHDVASHIDRGAREPFYDSVRRALKPGAPLVIFGPHGDAGTMLEVLARHGFAPANAGALAKLSGDELDARLAAGIVFHRTDGPAGR